MTKKIIMILSIFAVILCLNQLNIQAANKEGYQIWEINIYQNTPAWDLARAVKGQNSGKIVKIVKNNPDLLNYQEPKYGATLLLWAVGTGKYQSVETLLKCGANPDIATTSEGETPLFIAAGLRWRSSLFYKDPKYVKLLLRYGADLNKNFVGFSGKGYRSMLESGTSPLMNSIWHGIKKTKALVEGGADINYKTKSGRTAAIEALISDNVPEYAYYLIVEKKAKVNEPYYRAEHVTMRGDNPNDKFYPVDLLRYMVFDLDSKEYKMKMEIVKEFERQGVNYWDTKINKFTLAGIKKRYPKTWEEYIKKY
jgi:hypothetical protein